MWQLHATCRLLASGRSEKPFEFYAPVFPPKCPPISRGWDFLSPILAFGARVILSRAADYCREDQHLRATFRVHEKF
ncbi:hypothetical protein TIFTF001_032567 [Ficus carica]|uniref:Uncharacterized protein n=1 Tax=Ficus carica TaxID=3494 RepID=A0AA88J6M7_FICCA|nr:hypothetical protein TIFTF001_032567 [Ficus carica]